jgi:hypothetical protein
VRVEWRVPRQRRVKASEKERGKERGKRIEILEGKDCIGERVDLDGWVWIE